MRRTAGFQGAALAQLRRRPIDDDRYPPSPRLAPLKAILAKIDPPQPRPEPPPRRGKSGRHARGRVKGGGDEPPGDPRRRRAAAEGVRHDGFRQSRAAALPA